MLRIVQLLRSLLLILITVVAQGIQFLRWALTSRVALSAEVLFLSKQMVFYQEHKGWSRGSACTVDAGSFRQPVVS